MAQSAGVPKKPVPLCFAMEIDNVEELLDYVFTEKDFSLTPSEAEYRKLGRIMVIMIRFYEKGSATKKAEYDRLMGDMARLDVDEKMITEQIEVLQNFPPIHPKRGEYEANLEEELEALRAARERVAPQITHWKELYDWSLKIVETVNWLGKQLEEYSNHAFQTKLEVNPEASKLSVELFRIYKRGLDEITYNLQESQDFFDASLDGRYAFFLFWSLRIAFQFLALPTPPTRASCPPRHRIRAQSLTWPFDPLVLIRFKRINSISLVCPVLAPR